MKISEILSAKSIIADLCSDSKDDILEEMAQKVAEQSNAVHATSERIRSALLARERLGSTGVGKGVAIPHAKISGLESLKACFGRHAVGVDFQSLDHQPVRLFFVLLVPENSAGLHLRALARVARFLKDDDFRSCLLNASTAEDIFAAFSAQDEKLS